VTEPEAPKPEEPKPEVTEPEAPKPEEPKPEVTEPEATKPEEPKPEVTEPEVPKSEAPKIEVTETVQKKKAGKKKIIIGCVIAAAVLVVVAISGFAINQVSEKVKTQKRIEALRNQEKEADELAEDAWEQEEQEVVTITIVGTTYPLDTEYLDLSGAMLTDQDIEPLSYLTNLRTINLDDNQITDLSVLEYATKMESVTFKNNRVSDIGFVEYMDNLTVIIGENNCVSDLSPLADKVHLTDVFFGNNQISDISALADCDELINVGFNEATLSDIEALSGKEKLKMVSFHNCGLTDISPLSGCTELKQVYLGENQITDVSPLRSAESMEDVWLDGNCLSANPKSFEGLTVDGQIAIYGNNLTDSDQVKIRDGMYGKFTIFGTSLTGNTPKPTQNPKATATPKPTKKPKATATPKPTQKPKATATPKPSGNYRVSRLTNEKLTAKAGTATVVGRRVSRLDELIIFPDFATWSGNEFDGGGDGSYGAFGSYSKRCGKQPDLQLAKDYIALLKNEYGVALEMTYSLDPGEFIGQFEYRWEGTVKGVTVEAELKGLTNGYTEYFTLEASENMYFVDTGERASGTNTTSSLSKISDYEKTYTVTPVYEVASGNNSIIMPRGGGFGGQGFSLNPEYTKGKKLTIDDFYEKRYLDYPKSPCFFAYYDEPRDEVYGTYHATLERIEHIEVEVLENKNGYQTLYFYAVFNDGQYYRYYMEGVCAPGANDVPTYSTTSENQGGSSGGSIDIPAPSTSTNTRRCALCDGDGWADCLSCGGDGEKMCTNCNGTGTYRAYGQSHDCSCLNGDVRCTSCSGRGEKRCTGCGGDGLY